MIQGEKWKVLIGNNLDLLPTLEDNSIDSIVTDPPYELGFMGKKWDSTGIAYNPDLWRECLRVLKPGGHLLSFGGTRTWHRIAVAIEDAGFEVRDSIAWMYGSGFPKSLDISKAIDKQAGAEREVIGKHPAPAGKSMLMTGDRTETGAGFWATGGDVDLTAPATPEAQQWEGWGTALKPAFEPIIVARKPLIGTVAENVLIYGTGGLNIDGSRVGNETIKSSGQGIKSGANNYIGGGKDRQPPSEHQGRWPANVILDEYTAGLLDEQSGIRPGGTFPAKRGQAVNTSFASGQETVGGQRSMGDTGGASRFFYVAKASKRDRNEGLEELEEKQATEMTGRSEGSAGLLRVREDGSIGENPYAGKSGAAKNFHPTVKPTELMRYLVKLVTPPNGLVLDPFTGSGSTGKAALLEGFSFLGIEMTEDYIPIIEGRLRHAETQVKENEGLF